MLYSLSFVTYLLVEFVYKLVFQAIMQMVSVIAGSTKGDGDAEQYQDDVPHHLLQHHLGLGTSLQLLSFLLQLGRVYQLVGRH